ncbi:MAG TPA: DUF1015 domain-containing protein [Terriglobales bacterium]|nr:DUF1015 domain-containing protein [Terriglobales bacterium]
MARILPFPALRYNPARVRLAEMVTQPYDKITAEMQERYYAASPHNLVRIILGKREPGDDGQNVYTRAAAAFSEWRKDGILIQEREPLLYAYAQEFAVPGSPEKRLERLGFIGLGQLEPYDAGVVFRHEQTHSGPKADRLNLLRATRAHFGQLFMLYNDPAGEIDSALAKVARYPAESEVRDEYDVLHRLWPIPGLIQFIRRRMENTKLIIADGHHRYETALNYQHERREQDPAAPLPGEAAYDWVMMTFINLYSEGLVILPTHRVIAGLESFGQEQFLESAQVLFHVEQVQVSDATQATAILRSAGSEGTALLAVTQDGSYLLRTRPREVEQTLGELSAHQRGLDVVVLHKLGLELVLGISEEAIREQRYISYLRDASEAIARVRNGADVAFLMNPVRIEQVRDTAFAGEVLPQKSTDFYPKLLSGLTIYALD